MNWLLLKNSLLVSASAAALATLFGWMAAVVWRTLPPALAKVFLALGIAVLALPHFLVTACWLKYLGYAGSWKAWLPLNIYTPGGTIWILFLMLWPIAALLVFASLRVVSTELLESDSALRGWPLLRHLVWPASASAAALAAAITFVLALNNFTVPALLQTKVFTAEMWLAFNTTFDHTEAFRLSWPLLICPFLFLLLPARKVAWSMAPDDRAWQGLRRQLRPGWFALGLVCSLLLSLLSLGLPLAEIILSKETWNQLGPAWAAGKTQAWNSFLLASLAAAGCLAIGLLTRRYGAGKILWAGFFTPGIFLGILFIRLLGGPQFDFLTQTIAIVILAFLIRYAGLAWSGTRHAFSRVDPDLVDSARVLGLRGWRLFWVAQWPQVSRELLGVAGLIYVLTLWDVESLALIVPPGGENLSWRVFNMLHYGHTAQVNAICLILLLLALVPVVVYALAKKARLVFALAGSLLALPGAGCRDSSAAHKSAPLASALFSSVQVIGSRGAGAGQFNKPRSIAVDNEDNVYVVDMTGRVQKFSPEGKYLLSWQMPQTDKGKPKGMQRDSFGNVIVIEPHYSRVNHFLGEGQLKFQWGDNGTNVGQLYFPRAVAVNHFGELYVSEYGFVDRVQRFSSNGVHCLSAFGERGTGQGQFDRAEGLGIGLNHEIYVADSCNHRIQVFSREGVWLRSFGEAGSAPGQLSYPYDVRVDPAGFQFVCEFGNSRIQVFGPAGKSVELIGRLGQEPAQFHNPWAIALDSKGNLYVADSSNHRVQKFLRRAAVLEAQAETRRHEEKKKT